MEAESQRLSEWETKRIGGGEWKAKIVEAESGRPKEWRQKKWEAKSIEAKSRRPRAWERERVGDPEREA